MWDPHPDDKDQFVQTFEGLIQRNHDEEIDEELRQKIRDQIDELADTVSYDK